MKCPGKSIEMESKLVGIGRKRRQDCQWVWGFSLGWWKFSKIRWWQWLHSSMNKIKPTKLCKFKRWILWYMNYKICLCITGEAALPKQAMLWDAPIRFTWLVSRLYPDWRSQHRAKEGLGTKRGKALSNFKCSCTPISFKMQISQHGWSHLDKKKTAIEYRANLR